MTTCQYCQTPFASKRAKNCTACTAKLNAAYKAGRYAEVQAEMLGRSAGSEPTFLDRSEVSIIECNE